MGEDSASYAGLFALRKMSPNVHWIGWQVDLSHYAISEEDNIRVPQPRIELAYSLVTMQDVLMFLIVSQTKFQKFP